MSHIYLIGAEVALKNPLSGEPKGPWKVVGIKITKAPPEYKLFHKGAGKGRFIEADEGELLRWNDAQTVSYQVKA